MPRITFIALTVFFIIAAPIAVLYTAGYRMNLRTGGIVRVGMIIVDGEPRDAGVWLNGRPVGSTLPTYIKNVREGETYDLEVRRDGYFSLKKRLTVKNGRSVILSPLFLIREAEPRHLFAQNADALAVDDATLFFVTHTTSTRALYRIDEKNGAMLLYEEKKRASSPPWGALSRTADEVHLLLDDGALPAIFTYPSFASKIAVPLVSPLPHPLDKTKLIGMDDGNVASFDFKTRARITSIEKHLLPALSGTIQLTHVPHTSFILMEDVLGRAALIDLEKKVVTILSLATDNLSWAVRGVLPQSLVRSRVTDIDEVVLGDAALRFEDIGRWGETHTLLTPLGTLPYVAAATPKGLAIIELAYDGSPNRFIYDTEMKPERMVADKKGTRLYVSGLRTGVEGVWEYRVREQ